jgi:predicted Zn-dependent peptidase
MGDAIVRARNAVAGLQIEAQADIEPSMDPATRLEQVFIEIMRVDGDPLVSPPGPQLIVVAGDVEVTGTIDLIEAAFGGDAFEHREAGAAELFKAADRVINLGQPVAQAQLGYIVAAPGPRERLSDAWRLLLYILSHDYEGRLGKKAISESGLAYYISSEYRSDGTNAWVTLSTGVDAHKIEALQSLLSAELRRLLDEPPTMAEIDEAKTHMLGRLVSAAQSNAELSTRLATHWLWYGEALTAESLRRRLDAISRQDVLDIVPLFIDGATIVVAE